MEDYFIKMIDFSFFFLNLDPIIELLTDDDWGVRTSATKALGDIKDKKAIDPIKKKST